MRGYDDDEARLIELIRRNGGELTVFFAGRYSLLQHPNNPIRFRSEAKALSRLLRGRQIRRVCSGDFGWVMYRLNLRNKPTVSHHEDPLQS